MSLLIGPRKSLLVPRPTLFGVPYNLGRDSTTANTSTVTLDIEADVPAGFTIVAGVWVNNTSANIVSFADPINGGWSGNTQLNDATVGRLRMFSVVAQADMPLGTLLTCTLGGTTTNNRSLGAVAFGGAGARDKSIQGTSGSGTAIALGSGTGDLNSAPQMAVAHIVTKANAGINTTPAGWADLNGFGADYRLMSVFETPTPDSLTPTWVPASSCAWAIQMMTFARAA